MRLGWIGLCVLALVSFSCKSQTRSNSTTDLSLITETDGGSEDFAMSVDTDGPIMSSMDFSGLEAGTFLIDLSIDNDASGCLPGQTGTACPTAIDPSAGCMAVEDCVATPGAGNGLDDDCDGHVDNGPGCGCTPGDVKRCFNGPPGKRDVGGCTDGTQTCIGSLEFGAWDDCVGSIGPMAETCDGLDN